MGEVTNVLRQGGAMHDVVVVGPHEAHGYIGNLRSVY
jgi:hypothetical protein